MLALFEPSPAFHPAVPFPALPPEYLHPLPLPEVESRTAYGAATFAKEALLDLLRRHVDPPVQRIDGGVAIRHCITPFLCLPFSGRASHEASIGVAIGFSLSFALSEKSERLGWLVNMSAGPEEMKLANKETTA